jgi:hypothetical protein
VAEFAGSAQALSWINTAGLGILGTLNMAVDTRQFDLGANQSVIDATAGSDQFQQSIPSFVTYSPAASGVLQDGTQGTVYAQALKAGVQGTLIYGPSGTATGAVKYTIPAFSMGMGSHSPYADVSTWDVAWSVASGGNVTITAY